MRRILTAALTALLVVFTTPAHPALAASAVRVVIVVGPVDAGTNAHNKSDGDAIATEARRYTSNVVRLYTPNATWARVKAAAQGAGILVYLGHGNGWPSIYPPFQMLTKDGLGLDPSTGADGVQHVYYGEDYIRNNMRLAPNSVVLLYHLCYASGAPSPGLAVGTLTDVRERIDNYGAGFIGAGARAVFVEGHPDRAITDLVHQLFTTARTMDQVFRAAATYHGHVRGPYDSRRTPGLRYELDSDTSTPSGFYRSVIGNLSLAAPAVTGVAPVPTGTIPPDFVVPGAAEVAGASGTGLFATAGAAADLSASPGATLVTGSRLRISAESPAATDGTRVFAVSMIGGTASGFVRATELAPRDSAATAVWTLDQSGALLSPNADRLNDGLVVMARLSEPVTATLTVKNTTGATAWTQSLANDIVRFAWDLRTTAGTLVPDAAYTWTLRTKDGWGNAGTTSTGTFTVDGTAPVTRATSTSTAGRKGWIVSPVTVSLRATDALSGVASVSWRVDGGSARTYGVPVAVTVNGTRLFEFRATDRAGVREAWKALTFKVDTKPPVIMLAPAGIAGAVAGVWRGPVTVTPAVTDATSGVATRTISVDGAAPVPLTTSAVVVGGDGRHTVAVSATDVAGNASSASTAFTVDTVAPVVFLPPPADPAAPPPLVTPNGDGRGETVALPYSVSEASSFAAVVTGETGTIVRTLALVVPTGAGAVTWDGRTAAGVPVADGRYTLTLTPTDTAGNVGAPVALPVDVYASLASVVRTPVQFYPQDADALATRTTVSFRLVSPAAVTIEVLDAGGAVVRTAMTDAPLPAGPSSWAWDGRKTDGTFVSRGTYRLVVRASNGTQAAEQLATVVADAFKITTSVASPIRGRSFTVTAVSSEPLSTTPVVTMTETGVTSWMVTMTKVSASTWKAIVTPKTAGAAGMLALTVKAKDTGGRYNATILRLVLR